MTHILFDFPKHHHRPKMKIRKLVLHRDKIYYLVDAKTMKLSEASLNQADVKASAAVESDSEDNFDGSILADILHAREAHLRDEIQFCLKEKGNVYVTDDADEDNTMEFVMQFPVEFNDAVLKSTLMLMKDYFVKSCLFDWYNHAGVRNTAISEQELQQLEDDIVSNLRGHSAVHRPLQPF